ncbi:MAG: hypothetical protein ACLUVP_08750 [Acutalibacter sp.]
MRKNDLQRDKAFRQRLAQKLEVEQPPESYFQAVQDAFASLPDELPVKARPIHQRVLRTCAALAACCVVVAAGAFGLNQVSPQLMESMPGIGQIFQDFNEGREPPVPTPSPTPPSETESQLEQQEVQQEVPPFEPISVPSNTGVGELTIQNAWSDGLYLHLELELAAEGIPFDTAYASSISPCDDPYVEGTDTSHLWVNNLEAEKIATIENGLGFVWTGESTDGGATPIYAGEWVYRLPQNAAQGPDLSVSLEVPFLYTRYDDTDTYALLDMSFQADFSVTMDTRQTLIWKNAVEDNGVTLEQARVSPTCVTATVQVFNFGSLNSTLLVPLEQLVSGSDRIPVGIYGQLTTPDGTVLAECDSRYLESGTLLSSSSPGTVLEDGSTSGTMVFDGIPAGESQVILTLYEYPTGIADAYGAATPMKNRVTAEFTFDLDQGAVYPSQNYLAQGREKLDVLTSAQLDRIPAGENGYICQIPDNSGGTVEITLFTQDLDYRGVTLYWYNGDQIMSMYPSVPSSSYNKFDEIYPYYQGDYYTYGEVGLDPAYTNGKTYKALYFRLENTGSMNLTSSAMRFALIDNNTGEVLVEDVMRSALGNFDQIFGTSLEEQLYGAAEGEGTASEVLSSPSPSPLPEESVADASSDIG